MQETAGCASRAGYWYIYTPDLPRSQKRDAPTLLRCWGPHPYLQLAASECRRRQCREQKVMPLKMMLKCSLIYCGCPSIIDCYLHCSKWTPLIHSAFYDRFDVCRLLVECKADLTAENRYSQPRMYLFHLPHLPPRSDGETALEKSHHSNVSSFLVTSLCCKACVAFDDMRIIQTPLKPLLRRISVCDEFDELRSIERDAIARLRARLSAIESAMSAISMRISKNDELD